MKTYTPPIVQLDHVVKRFGDATIIDGISLQANKGEFISLVGPSGCGKSTLLKLIAGLHSTSEGSLVVDGMQPKDAREEMAFIFQEANLLPWRRVLANAELPLMLAGEAKERRQQKACELLELVGLSHALDRFPWQLSGGMKMRVSTRTCPHTFAAHPAAR